MTTVVPARTMPAIGRRSGLRAVALPAEHGGWGLTLEPGLLGLLLVPSVAGALLALAALLAFVARTPLKVVAVDLRRRRRLPRTSLAAAVGAVELAVLAAVVAGATTLAARPFWPPLALAIPFVAVEGWFEVRSRGRRLVPELAGAIGVASVAAAGVLAGGGPTGLAVGAWLLLAGRVATSIPFVRAQIGRLHGRPSMRSAAIAADATAIVLAAAAVAVCGSLALGAAALVIVIVLQRSTGRGSVPRPAILGARQLVFGVLVVVAAAAGAHLS